jgi:hypothetical protein
MMSSSSAVDDEIVTARCGWNDKDLVADIEDMPCCSFGVGGWVLRAAATEVYYEYR